MRVALVRPGPQFSVQDVADGWFRALCDLLPGQVVDLRLDNFLNHHDAALHAMHGEGGFTFRQVRGLANEAVDSRILRARPDIVIVVSGFFTPPEQLESWRAAGITTVLLATESPYEDDNQVPLAPHYDLVLLNDPTGAERFEAEGARVHYVPHAYDPERHARQTPSPEWVSEFCFVGTGYQERIDFFEAVDWSDIDVAFAGNWAHLDDDSPLRGFLAHPPDSCCFNSEAVQLYSSTLASANFYRTTANRPELSAGWAMGPREVELAALGTFYLTQERGENRDVLPMVPTFDGADDFGEKLRWWLDHGPEREEVARKAREAIAPRTFTNHAAEVLRLLT